MKRNAVLMSLKPLLVALFLMVGVSGFATVPTKVDKAVENMVSKYEDKQGVECLRVVKGEGLELIKMMLNKEFGRKFMKGVTSIVIMEYSDAPADICQSIRDDLDMFTSVLEEFDTSAEKELSSSEFVRCFIGKMDSESISDFVVVMEDDGEKMFMYMGGKIIMEL